MEKFDKLNRAEMKNVTGGTVPPRCIVVCQSDLQPIREFTAGIPDCTYESLAVCVLGGHVISCECTQD